MIEDMDSHHVLDPRRDYTGEDPQGMFGYMPELDDERLTAQQLRVFNCMKDHQWRTLNDIEAITGDPEASVSATLRHLRRASTGSFVVEKRRVGSPLAGLFEYRLLPPNPREKIARQVLRRRFVLHPGTDVYARVALMYYANITPNKARAAEIRTWLKRYQEAHRMGIKPEEGKA